MLAVQIFVRRDALLSCLQSQTGPPVQSAIKNWVANNCLLLPSISVSGDVLPTRSLAEDVLSSRSLLGDTLQFKLLTRDALPTRLLARDALPFRRHSPIYQKTLSVMSTIKHDPAIEYQPVNHHRGT